MVDGRRWGDGRRLKSDRPSPSDGRWWKVTIVTERYVTVNHVTTPPTRRCRRLPFLSLLSPSNPTIYIVRDLRRLPPYEPSGRPQWICAASAMQTTRPSASQFITVQGNLLGAESYVRAHAAGLSINKAFGTPHCKIGHAYESAFSGADRRETEQSGIFEPCSSGRL